MLMTYPYIYLLPSNYHLDRQQNINRINMERLILESKNAQSKIAISLIIQIMMINIFVFLQFIQSMNKQDGSLFIESVFSTNDQLSGSQHLATAKLKRLPETQYRPQSQEKETNFKYAQFCTSKTSLESSQNYDNLQKQIKKHQNYQNGISKQIKFHQQLEMQKLSTRRCQKQNNIEQIRAQKFIQKEQRTKQVTTYDQPSSSRYNETCTNKIQQNKQMIEINQSSVKFKMTGFEKGTITNEKQQIMRFDQNQCILMEFCQRIYETVERNNAVTADYAHFLIPYALILKIITLSSPPSAYSNDVLNYIKEKLQKNEKIRRQIKQNVIRDFWLVIFKGDQKQVLSFLAHFLITEKLILTNVLPYYYNLFALVVNKQRYFKGGNFPSSYIEYTVKFAHRKVVPGNFTQIDVMEMLDSMEEGLNGMYNSENK